MRGPTFADAPVFSLVLVAMIVASTMVVVSSMDFDPGTDDNTGRLYHERR